MNDFLITLLGLVTLNQTLPAQEQLDHSAPRWLRDFKFDPGHFTFVRIRYEDVASAARRRGSGERRWRRRGRGSWATDYPDADLAISKHLAMVTSLRVEPKGKVLRLTDGNLSDYRFIYIVEPGRMQLSDAEVKALRRYLTGGGFLMVDDFWGEREWQNFYFQFRRVFPDREPVELPLEHEIFHCVYDLKEKPQIPSIHYYLDGQTTERWDAQVPHYRAVFDDSGRMMALICHNTDLADGWEGIGDGGDYAKEYSLKKAIPMGTNVIFYALRLAETSR